MEQKIVLQSSNIIKTIVALLLSMTFFLFLTACNEKSLTIENHEWNLRYAYQVKDNQVNVIAKDKHDSAYPDAKIVKVILKAEDGIITISDQTNNVTYTGTYALESTKPKEQNYKVIINGQDGYATVAMTTYADKSEEPTLPINFGEYSLYFYSEK